MHEVIQAIREFSRLLDEADTIDDAREAFEAVQDVLEELPGFPKKPARGGRFCASCGRRLATVGGREPLHKADCPGAKV